MNPSRALGNALPLFGAAGLGYASRCRAEEAANGEGEIMRILLGIVAGVVVAFVCVFAIEMVGHTAYPPPPDIDLTKPADVERLMATLPVAALAFVVAAWFIGALAGAWTANRIAKRALAGWIVALLIACGAVWTMTIIPHPGWMWGAGIGLPIAAAWLAQRLARVSV